MAPTGLYQKNVDFLKENCPQLWKQIKGKNSGSAYTVLPAREKGLYCIEASQKGGGSLLLHSRYNPVREAEMWAAKQDLAGIRHVVLYGFGLGYHVEALLENHPDLSFYIYEPDVEIFLATLEYRDWSTFPWERVFIVFEHGNDRSRVFVEHVVNLAKSGWTFLTIPAFERCFSERLEELAESLKNARQSYVESLLTNVVFEKEWTVNALKNLPYLWKCEYIFHCKKYFQGRTAVMTASGPSLTEAVPYIKKIKECKQALIVAAGTSVNGLLKYGLVPDMFVSYDPFPGNYNALKPALSWGAPLVFGSTINHDVVKNHVGPKAYFILSQDTVFNYLHGALESAEVIEDAPSIAVVTLRLLDKLGIREVILAGQDLAFVGDRYYADGIGVARPENVLDIEKEAAVEVDSNSGGKVLTSRSFIRMKESLEQVISLSRFERVINTSPRGAKIAGTFFLEWDDVMGELSNCPAGEPPVFKESAAVVGLRKLKRTVKSILMEIEEDFISALKKAEEFLNLDESAAEAKKERIFEDVSRSVEMLTSQKKFAAFISPMIRNEEHLLRKSLGDIRYMSWEEKRNFVAVDLKRYLNGIQASLFKLKEAVEEWG
ncbi:MAG: motility associated factor glycosyltransferase family protein [Firmicutes bacterium]|nr:motility associated factor glycosyltransferase family protein [Bacillota bacterium]